MANSLKVKLAIAGFAIPILILIPLLQNSFYAPVKIKRWGKVTWDDFKGIPKPFSSYEAGISSAIYLEYDSARGRYAAYAGQNNVQSWAKRSRDVQDYLLTHEQYHFNITELHARKLDQYIAENPDGSTYQYLLRLGSINIDLDKMQDQYDRETGHSVIYDKQRRWEYRIDSLLTSRDGWITDHFSGARAYFPQPPDSVKGLADGIPYRYYSLSRYGMMFLLTSYQASNVNYQLFATKLRTNIHNRAKVLRKFSIDTTESFRAYAISEDSSNYTVYQLWSEARPYLYCIETRFPNNTGDTTGYWQNASSFLNSFHIMNTDSYWIQKRRQSDSPINVYKVSAMDDEEDCCTRYCIKIGPAKRQGFYRGPFFRNDGALFLAYDYLVDSDTSHFEDILLLNQDSYSYSPTHDGQIFFVPANRIPESKYRIQFGYLLLADSVKECYEFHHETLQITPHRNVVLRK